MALGNYTLEIVKDGYIVGYYNLYSCLAEEGQQQTIVLTPELADGEYRVVLTWSNSPSDLDSHLTYYQGEEKLFHVYYLNKQGMIDGIKVATLDLDDTSGYGPETVTITIDSVLIEEDGYFRYSVHNFSGEESLSNSGAIVRVYKGNNLVETYPVPGYRTGNVWRVFILNKNGIIKSDYFYNSTSRDVS